MSMNIDSSESLISSNTIFPTLPNLELKGLFSDNNSERYTSIRNLKHVLIGNLARKREAIPILLPQVIEFTLNPDLSPEVFSESLVVLASFSYGPPEAVTQILNSPIFPILLSSKFLTHSVPTIQHNALYALMSFCFNGPSLVDTSLIYDNRDIVAIIIEHFSSLSRISQYAATILYTTCTTCAQQNILLESHVLDKLSPKLREMSGSLRIHFLTLLSVLLKDNFQACQTIAQFKYEDNFGIVELLTQNIIREVDHKIKLISSKCLVYLYKKNLLYDERIVPFKLLHRLVRLTKREIDSSFQIQTEALSILACLIEKDDKLKKQLAITDHFIIIITDYLKSANDNEKNSEKKSPEHMDINDFLSTYHSEPKVDITPLKIQIFQVMSCLASTHAEIRRCITWDKQFVMQQIEVSLQSTDIDLLQASLNFLISLSRSVVLHKTCFSEIPFWKYVLKLSDAQLYPHNILISAYALLVNLTLEFSSCKEQLISENIIEKFYLGTFSEDTNLSELCFRGLANSLFMASSKVKETVSLLSEFPTFLHAHMINPKFPNLTLQCVSVFRNMFTNEEEIEEFIKTDGDITINILVDLIINESLSIDIHSQSLCVLSNITSGSIQVRKTITDNQKLIDLLNQILNYSSVEMQLAAVSIIGNLVDKDIHGFIDRQNLLESEGIKNALQKLEKTTYRPLSDLVRDVMENFTADF